MPDPDDRLTLLERLAAQQVEANDILVELVRRLEHEQFLHDAAQHRHAERLDQHTDALARLTALAERQQQLHADLHGTMAGLLTLQEAQTARQERHAERLALLETIASQHESHVAGLEELAAQHQARMERLDALLQAIKDLLDRPNGR